MKPCRYFFTITGARGIYALGIFCCIVQVIEMSIINDNLGGGGGGGAGPQQKSSGNTPHSSTAYPLYCLGSR